MGSAIKYHLKKKLIAWLIFILASFNITFGANISELILKKQNWIKANGTVVWVGLKFERKRVIACRMNDNYVLVYKPWGLSKQYSTQEVIYCPDFFNQISSKNTITSQGK
ncbi:MAG: hypothetical protein HOD92_25640 [Deltaproteobacteria bacterium]|jgi:hypothetical protein|nr:hypothetical protein [Deltaproteobacteria bacterium]MBT4525444.1 hypothetical protein [Deltaproteobacteria bacterium]